MQRPQRFVSLESTVQENAESTTGIERCGLNTGLFSQSAYKAFVTWFEIDTKISSLGGGDLLYESYSCAGGGSVVACHYLRERLDSALAVLKNYPGFNRYDFRRLPTWYEPHLRKTLVFVVKPKTAD